jgi:hypothetical protein
MSDLGNLTGSMSQAEPLPADTRGPVGGEVTEADAKAAGEKLVGGGMGGLLSSMVKSLGGDDVEALGQKRTQLDGTAETIKKVAAVRDSRADNQGENVDTDVDGMTPDADGMFEFEDEDGNTVQLSREDAVEQLRNIKQYEKAAARKMTDADKYRKEGDAKLNKVIQAVSTFKDDPESIFRATDSDPAKFSWDHVSKDPDFIQKAATEIQRQLAAQEAERAITPEQRAASAAQQRIAELERQVQTHEDAKVEQKIFNTTYRMVQDAGLVPDEMVAINAIELQRSAEARGMKLGPQEYALLLRNHYLKQAENLMKGRPAQTPDQTVAQAQRKPVARVVSRPAAPKPAVPEEPISALEGMRRMMASPGSPYYRN